jgi:hypothetical protein
MLCEAFSIRGSLSSLSGVLSLLVSNIHQAIIVVNTMQTNTESLDYEIYMPIPPHIHRHTQQHLYTHGRPSRRADLVVVVKRVLILPSTTLPSAPRRHIVAAGENGNDLNYFRLYLNKSVMVIIIKIYDRERFL